ncbi:hypothetical protein [Microcoleus sp.]|uniref:hypothetical protein n=1 Tax=Microcoleus sp. TaxID=44472 RepID=UPI00403E6FB2
MKANIRGVAVSLHNIDTDAAGMSLQPKLKAAGDRTSPILHINILDNVPNYRGFWHPVLQ